MDLFLRQDHTFMRHLSEIRAAKQIRGSATCKYSTQSDPYQALMTIDTKYRKKTTESESENQTGGQQSKFYFMASGLTTSSPQLLAKSPPCHTKCTDV